MIAQSNIKLIFAGHLDSGHATVCNHTVSITNNYAVNNIFIKRMYTLDKQFLIVAFKYPSIEQRGIKEALKNIHFV